MGKLLKIRQRLQGAPLEDVAARVAEEFERVGLSLSPGASVAVAVGSRGISRLVEVVRATVRAVRERGGEPFIVPAMGSHGGATAEGQIAVLASLGVTEDAVAAPIRSSMEVAELPRGKAPCRLFTDRNAFEADATIVINRVKSHTDFHSTHESGLVKMTVIGLGKQAQALEIHQHGVRGLKEYLPVAAERILQETNIVLGLALVEDGYHRLAQIRAARPEEFLPVDRAMLALARKNMPALPVDDLDILVVDEMGKDVSGTGMDTNIIGRMRISGELEPERPRIKAIVVCDLTAASHGNAVGMGLADVITRRLFDKIDLEAVAQNAVTAVFFDRGMIPIVAKYDRQAFEWATRLCGPKAQDQLRVARVRNTLSLQDLHVSRTVWEEVEGKEGIVKLGEEKPLFDSEGTLTPF